jgi:hypothetical protein
VISKSVVLRGSLSWGGEERRSDRYGGIMLCAETVNVNEGAKSKSIDLGPVRHLVGKRVKISATVLESNVSCHIGDFFRGIGPSQTPVGKTVYLGTGQFLEITNNGDFQSIIFCRDGREHKNDWISPKTLYRLHDHVVDLKITEMSNEA